MDVVRERIERKLIMENYKQLTKNELLLCIGGDDTAYNFGHRLGQDIANIGSAIKDGAVSACESIKLCEGN